MKKWLPLFISAVLGSINASVFADSLAQIYDLVKQNDPQLLSVSVPQYLCHHAITHPTLPPRPIATRAEPTAIAFPLQNCSFPLHFPGFFPLIFNFIDNLTLNFSLIDCTAASISAFFHFFWFISGMAMVIAGQ